MNLMGLDVAFTNVGWLVVNPDGFQYVACGVIRTKRQHKKLKLSVTQDDIRRIRHIVSELQYLIKHYEVGGVAAEFPTGGSQSAVSTKGLGIALGAVISLFSVLNVPLLPQTPGNVKKAIGGSANAPKEVLASVAYRRWPKIRKFTPKSVREHITDAAATLLASRDWEVYHELFMANATRRVLTE